MYINANVIIIKNLYVFNILFRYVNIAIRNITTVVNINGQSNSRPKHKIDQNNFLLIIKFFRKIMINY